MAITGSKRYLYKVFDDSEYLGMLENVVSEFSYSQDINSGAAQLSIELAMTVDTVGENVESISDEQGNPILDESSNPLTEESTPNIFGRYTGGTLVANNNVIKVYEYSNDDPNGQLVFDGYVTSIEANLGSTENMVITVISRGVDLSEYVIQSGDTTVASAVLEDTTITGAYWGFALAQVIKPSSTISLSRVTVKVNGSASGGNVYLYQGDPSTDVLTVIGGSGSYSTTNTLLATIGGFAVSNSSSAEETFSLASPVTLSAGQTYYILIRSADGTLTQNSIGTGVEFKASNTLGTLPIEKAYYARATINNSSFGLTYDTAKDTIYIKLIESTGNTTSTYTSQDPTAIFEDIITDYNGQGGVATYTDASTDNTGLSVTYTFNTNTALEGIQKCLELAPYDWYWYTDPGSLTAYFKQTATTATHRFIKGRHISSLKLRLTVDHVVNKLYFSGGDTGAGDNLYRVYTNSTSVTANGRQRLKRISDNRVTVAATANTIADNELDLNATESYESSAVISAANYDLTSINIGDTVGFRGFGGFIDSLVLQIVRLNKHADYLEVGLGRLPVEQTKKTVQTLRDIVYLQTVDNPTTPS